MDTWREVSKLGYMSYCNAKSNEENEDRHTEKTGLGFEDRGNKRNGLCLMHDRDSSPSTFYERI